jgi:methylmalonyl-CoA mutase N-terminal domain/subunit
VIAALGRWRDERDVPRVHRALGELKRTAAGPGSLMPASVECARAGVTTGEWSWALREVFTPQGLRYHRGHRPYRAGDPYGQHPAPLEDP